MCLGIPGKIVKIFNENNLRMATVDYEGIRNNICLEYLPEAKINDYTIVHAGFGISLLNEKEANETIKLIDELRNSKPE